MNTGSRRGLLPAACAGLLLASCSGAPAPAHRAAESRRPASPPATWASGVTAADASAGTATTQTGVEPWLQPAPGPAPTASRSRGCAALHDPGWRAGCVRVDTGAAVLTGVVEGRSAGSEVSVWKATVWKEEGQQEVQTLAAGDPTTPLWEWAAVRSADLVGNHHQELVFGFENQGTGEVRDLDVVAADGAGLVAGQLSVYKGTAALSAGRILTYHPVYRDDDPNCCPTGGADRDTVQLERGRWVVVGSSPFALPGAGGPGFPDDFGPPRLR